MRSGGVYRRCGFPSHWAGTHRLRHTFATRLYRSRCRSEADRRSFGTQRSQRARTLYLHSDLVALQALALVLGLLSMRKMRNLARSQLPPAIAGSWATDCGLKGKLLLEFARFADREAPGQPVRLAVALRWAILHLPADRLSARLNAVELIRGSCPLLPRPRSPDRDPRHSPVRTRSQSDRKPHIYSSNGIELICSPAYAPLGHQSPSDPGRSLRFPIGSASCTGMRIGELLRLRVDDSGCEQSNHSHSLPAGPSPERVLPSYIPRRLLLRMAVFDGPQQASGIHRTAFR